MADLSEPGAGGGGVYLMLAPCLCCGQVFGSNPHLVPSYQGEPVCEDCIHLINRRRAEAGLELWPILPGAYDPVEAGA